MLKFHSRMHILRVLLETLETHDVGPDTRVLVQTLRSNPYRWYIRDCQKIQKALTKVEDMLLSMPPTTHNRHFI
jgi:hypothetical protein